MKYLDNLRSSITKLISRLTVSNNPGSNLLESLQKQSTSRPKLGITLAILGIILFIGIATTVQFNGGLFSRLFYKVASMAAPITNLVTNGGFETGSLSGWGTSGSVAVISSPVHSGAYGFRSTGGSINRNIAVTAGKTYKVSGWVYINNVSGGTWGGPTIDVINTSTSPWSYYGRTPLLQDVLPTNNWMKVGFSFTPNTSSINLNIGNFGDRVIDVNFDDLAVFEKPLLNSPPTTTVSSNVSSVGTIPGTVNFSSVSDDPDGTFNTFWDFGDGGRSSLPNPSHQYISNGTYTAKATVVDDDGDYVEGTKTITISDPSYPTITTSSPASPTTTTSSAVTAISGIATSGSGASLTKVSWSTDRGQTGTATGTTNWNFNLDLTNFGGKNRLTINAYSSTGKVARSEVIIDYRPTSKIAVLNGAAGVAQNSSSVERYDKFEATFSLQNSVAPNQDLPYETGLPPGMKAAEGAGVTVEGIFTSPSGQSYTQPGFLYQPYVRNTGNKTLVPSGNPVWKIRFSPQELGSWTYQVRVTDASGSTTVNGSQLQFSVITPTNANNHGFIKVSPTDKRYFEFSDGTTFNGLGPAGGIDGLSSFNTDTNLTAEGLDNANLARTWMSGNNIGGSSWAPWTGGIPYDGNVPGTSLTTDETYGDGIYSLTLPQLNGGRCNFYGFQGDQASIKTNTNYRVMVRLKTVMVPTTGGFNLRFGGINWPGGSCDGYVGTSPFTDPDNGTKDWHVVTGSWNSGSNNKLGFVMATLENVTSGRVYIDEISVREDLGSGNLGPEVLPRSKFNTQNYFSQEPSFNWDYGLDQYAQRGIYNKIVIAEKQDFSYNHIDPSGFGFDKGGQMESATGATLKYQQHYWRYLIARYGYSRAVHSFEYANEQAPGNLYMAEELSKYMHTLDPSRHLANTSNWAGLDGDWSNQQYQNVDYADAHAYVQTNSAGQGTTSWLGTTDPITGANTGNDSALYVAAHSIDQFTRNAAGNKPMVIGEAGVGNSAGTLTAGNNDTDTQGVWLHQYIWANLNRGGAYFIYWYVDTLFSHQLSPLFGPYRKFMEGQAGDTINKRVPLNNGKYQDVGLTLPAGVRGWGQKDIVNGGAHFWIYDQNYSWTNTGGGTAVGGKQVSFTLPAKNYIVEFWNTWPSGWTGITNAGQVTTQNINHPGGTMTLTIPTGIQTKDVAVKVIPATGYPLPMASSPAPQPSLSPSPSSSPPPSPVPSPTPKPGDINGDGAVGLFDFSIMLTNWGSPDTSSDLNGDGIVGLFDFSLLLTYWGS